jgi:hypothetical protein
MVDPMKAYRKIYRSLALTALVCAMYALTVSCASAQQAQSASRSGKIGAVPMRGLYLPNGKARDLDFVKKLMAEGKPLGVNMLVIDVHPYGRRQFIISPGVVEFLKGEKIYLAGRVVCFQDGIDRFPVPETELARIRSLVEETAKAGFHEVQLDYIRFKDGGYPYPLAKKYRFIEELLKDFRGVTDRLGVKLSADIFGRIVFNRNDYVGQKLEVFAKYAEIIYPMLYPSHFTGDFNRMAKPGETVREGLMKGQARLAGTGAVLHAYIQAFPYYIGRSGTDLPGYVALQIRAAEESGARGWVAWQAAGNHAPVFEALRRIAGGAKEPGLTRNQD